MGGLGIAMSVFAAQNYVTQKLSRIKRAVGSKTECLNGDMTATKRTSPDGACI